MYGRIMWELCVVLATCNSSLLLHLETLINVVGESNAAAVLHTAMEHHPNHEEIQGVCHQVLEILSS